MTDIAPPETLKKAEALLHRFQKAITNALPTTDVDGLRFQLARNPAQSVNESGKPELTFSVIGQDDTLLEFTVSATGWGHGRKLGFSFGSDKGYGR